MFAILNDFFVSYWPPDLRFLALGDKAWLHNDLFGLFLWKCRESGSLVITLATCYFLALAALSDWTCNYLAITATEIILYHHFETRFGSETLWCSVIFVYIIIHKRIKLICRSVLNESISLCYMNTFNKALQLSRAWCLN